MPSTRTLTRREAVRLVAAATLCLPSLLAGAPRTARADDISLYGADAPAISSATEAIAEDAEGNVLFSRNSSERMCMASITKVMTATVALESGVPLDTVYTFTSTALDIDPESSIIGYLVGESATLHELLYGLLVHSGNDAAMGIAECVGGSVDAFVEMMNVKAVALGMADSHFANPHGLDAEGHYSTAADLVVLGRHAMQLPFVRTVVGSPSTTVTLHGELSTFASTDELLNVYPGMRGIKTGYTYGAGRAFLGVASRDGQTVYVVVLGTESNAARWEDVQTLLDWSFDHLATKSLARTGTRPSGRVGFADRFGWSVDTLVTQDADVRLSATGENPVTGVEVNGDTSPSLARANSSLAEVIWQEQDGSAVAARTVGTGTSIVGTQTFGPFVSDVFYR